MCAEKPVLVAATAIATYSVPQVVCLVGLVVLGWSLTYTFLAMAGCAAILTIPVVWLTWREGRGSPFRWRWRELYEQFKFSIPVGVPFVVAFWTRWASTFVASFFYGPAAIAVFRNGSVELPIYPIITDSATAVIMPEMSAHAANNRPDLMMGVWLRAIRKIGFVILPSVAFLFAYGRESVLIMFSSQYLASLPIFLIMLFLLPFRIANFTTPLILAKKPRPVVVGSALGLVSVVVLSAVLIPAFEAVKEGYGLYGAALAAVVSRVLWTVYYIVVLRRDLGIAYRDILPWGYLGVVSVVSIAAAGVSLVAKLLHWAPVPQFAVGAVLFGAAFGALALVTDIVPALERARLLRLWRAIIGLGRRILRGPEARARGGDEDADRQKD